MPLAPCQPLLRGFCGCGTNSFRVEWVYGTGTTRSYRSAAEGRLHPHDRAATLGPKVSRARRGDRRRAVLAPSPGAAPGPEECRGAERRVSEPRTVAALYVEPDGPYAGEPGVDLWPESRDARTYAGPHPVVAHPPCNRWCSIAPVNVAQGRFRLGDDGGMFTHALDCVRLYGGVLEHPARTYAWPAYGLPAPPRDGGWIRLLGDSGWVCEVEQGHYGCRAPKPTWLYAVGCGLPDLAWGRSDVTGARISNLRSTGDHRARETRRGGKRTDGRKEASMTPAPFRDLLLSMARAVRV